MKLWTLARVAGGLYLVTFVAGVVQASIPGRPGVTAGLIATAAYVVVTALFYELFKPVDRRLALVAAFFSLIGCSLGPTSAADNVALVFFGFYCLLIGVLIWRSGFLPRLLGAGMLLAGVCWLTNLWPPLAAALVPYILIGGALGEGALTLWLLIMGVNVQRRDAAIAATATRGRWAESEL